MAEYWTIADVARRAAVTTRTLRHYDRIGLLPAARDARSGHRVYDAAALVRLQRILLLRQLGLGLPEIAAVLDREVDEARALHAHLAALRDERERIGRQIAAVEATVAALARGEASMPEEMFDGFDHTQYREEVEERWGAEAYARGDAWWRGLEEEGRRRWQDETARLGADWTDAAARGVGPADAEAQALAGRHLAWLAAAPGAPSGDLRGYALALADMYVADPRFAANYGGAAGAELVRAALRTRLDHQGD